MEKVKGFITKRNIHYVSIASGVLAFLMCILYFTISNANVENFSEIGSMFSTLKNLCNLFYVDVCVLFLLAGACAYRIFAQKDTSLDLKTLLICQGIIIIVALCTLRSVSAIKGITSGNLGSIMDMDMDALSFDGLIFIIVLQIMSAVISGYTIFLKKATNEEQAVDSNPSTTSAMERFKAYYQTKDGKRIVRITSISVGAIVILWFGYSIYQGTRRTTIDLTAACSVEFHGVSGRGDASIDCKTDFDKTNKDISTFMRGVKYEVENNGDLKNGEKAVLVASYSEATADSSKVRVENPTKEFDISGLEVVYESYGEIPTEAQEMLTTKAKEQLLESYKSTTEKEFFGPESKTYGEPVLVSTYFDKGKAHSTNSMYFIYRMNLSESYSNYTRNTVNYYTVSVRDITSLTIQDNTISFNANTLRIGYGDDISDANAIKSFKSLHKEIEVVSENAGSDIYKEEKIDK